MYVTADWSWKGGGDGMGVQTVVHPSCERVKLPSLGIGLPLWRTLNWSRHVEDTLLSLEIPVEGSRIRDKPHCYNTPGVDARYFSRGIQVAAASREKGVFFRWDPDLPHYKGPIPKNRNKYSQKRNCLATFRVCHDIFPWSICLNRKKAFRYSRPQPGCHIPNSPWAGIMTS